MLSQVLSVMTLGKRLQKIETSLTPREAVLLHFLRPMLDLGQEGSWKKMLADRSNPRIVVLQKVTDAVRENLSFPPLEPERLDQVVRDAVIQADTLMVLVMNLQERVRSEWNQNLLHIELLNEKLKRMSQQLTYEHKLDPKDFDSWRGDLVTILSRMQLLKKAVVSITSQYYNNHPLLFEFDEQMLEIQVEFLKKSAEEYNCLQRFLPQWMAIDIDAQPSAEAIKAQVAQYVSVAKAKTLADFGEEEEARKLMDSCAYHALREMTRLRSSSSRE